VSATVPKAPYDIMARCHEGSWSDSEGSIQRASSGLREACTPIISGFAYWKTVLPAADSGTVKQLQVQLNYSLLVGLVGVGALHCDTHSKSVVSSGGGRWRPSTPRVDDGCKEEEEDG
jgi:hypothetical protein